MRTPEEFSRHDLQMIALMLRTRKAFAEFLGLGAKELQALIKKRAIRTPAEYLRDQPPWKVVQRVALDGRKRTASFYGVSESSLQKFVKDANEGDVILIPQWTEKVTWTATKEEFLTGIEDFGSVRIMARCLDVPESRLREVAKEHALHLPALVTYDQGKASNAKGRRAEKEYARLRGSSILEDCNVAHGSQALTDFLDSEHNRVNVKSSRQWKYRATTRKKDPWHWKFSTKGLKTSDSVALMGYDKAGDKLLWMLILDVGIVLHEVGENTTITFTVDKLLKWGNLGEMTVFVEGGLVGLL